MRSPKSIRFLSEERRREILKLPNAEQRVTVADLSRRFKVSEVTIRGDL